MALRVSFGGTSIYVPGVYGVPLTAEQVAQNKLVFFLRKLGLRAGLNLRPLHSDP